MIISIVPPPKSCFKCIKHIQKLCTVINVTGATLFAFHFIVLL